MPKPTKGPRLGGSPTHERLMLRNLATQLFQHGRVTTTETKARRVQPLAEKLITKAKRGDLASRRLVLQSITDQSVVHTLFADIAPTFEGREGGYTRITKIGPRKGDNAPMAIIEVITESVEESRANRAKGPRAAAKADAPKSDSKAKSAKADKAEAEVPAVEETEEVETTEAEETAVEETAVEEAPEEAADEK